MGILRRVEKFMSLIRRDLELSVRKEPFCRCIVAKRWSAHHLERGIDTIVTIAWRHYWLLRTHCCVDGIYSFWWLSMKLNNLVCPL